MKVYNSHEIKNIALLGNDGSGKTTLTESLLFESGLIKKRGRITQKNTVSDYFPVEQDYGYSVFSTVFHTEWNGKKLNIIDCPGSDDFVGAALTALNVTDTAVLLLNGKFGPEVGTQNHFRYTEKLGKPVIFLVNQLDDEKCDYDVVLEQLQTIYGPKVVPVQYPMKTGPDFNSLIDVILMKKLVWGPEGGKPTIEDIPAEEMDKAQEMHKVLVEAAAENDEQLMEKFFETEQLTEDEMREREMERPSVKTVKPGPGPFQQHRKPGERTAHLPSPGDEDKGDAMPLSQSNLSVGDVKAKEKEIIFDASGKLYDEDEIEPKEIIFGEDGVIVDAEAVDRV